MRINIEGSHTGVSVEKALFPLQSNRFEYESIAQMVEERPVKPGLLTSLLTGNVQTETFLTDTFVHFRDIRSNVLPSGKSFSEFGAETKADKNFKEYRWGIPSFGIAGSVLPREWAGKYIVGTQDPMTEGYVLGRLNEKIGDAWDLFFEKQLLKLITTDSNDVAGGPFNSFDFYKEIVGGGTTSRVATNVDFTAADADVSVYKTIRDRMKVIRQRSIELGETMPTFILVCGSDAFAALEDLERKENVVREIRSTLDLQSMPMTENPLDRNSSFPVDNFRPSNMSGITVIEYSQSIDGVSIGDLDMYLIPVQASNFIRVGYTRSQIDRESLMTNAVQTKYAWSSIDNTGVRMWEESNYLTAMTAPDMMDKLVAVV